MYQTRAHKDAVAVEMLPGVVRRTMTESGKMMLCEISLAEGSIVPLHQHPHDQIGYVVEGAIRMQIGEEFYTFRAGDSYAIPGGIQHSGQAVGGPCKVIDVFSPVRDEYR